MYFLRDKTFETDDRNCVSDKTVVRNFVSINSRRLSYFGSFDCTCDCYTNLYDKKFSHPISCIVTFLSLVSIISHIIIKILRM